MSITAFIGISAAILAAYAAVVATAAFVARRHDAADEVGVAARAAFRKFFRFAN